ALLILFFTAPGFAALPLPDNNESPFTRIYEKVAPAVVMIEVEGEAPSRQDRIINPWERFFNFPIPQQEFEQRPQQGMGSGVIIDREGHIITNNHVVSNAAKITVRIDDKEEYKAKIVGRDPQSDLAVIQLELDGKLLPLGRVAELGDSDTLKPGDYAIAIGNPVGLERTITVGVVSALGRHGLQVMGAESLQFQDFIQTDAQINPGNSGGALVDINGKVVGINNMYTARYAAIGFAIPINLARNVVEKLIEYGEVKRGFVGIQHPPDGSDKITKDIQETMGLPSSDGVLVSMIIENSPAEKAGLVHGDVITTLDGAKVKDFNDFLLKIGNHSPGDTVKLGIIRDKKERTITLTLADRDEFQDVASVGGAHSWRGINVIDLDDQMAQQYGLSSIESGVVIISIDEDSPAAEANLSEGDVIIEIDSKPIKNIQDFERIKNDLKDSDKRILIYRARKISSGRIIKGYVPVKGE
ncbi:Do family serine endopeptidase, partial [Candidatus Latescibacterota bacterium]